MRIVEIGGALVEVHVRRSERARTTRATFLPGRPPEIVVPAATSERGIDRAIGRHRAWLARQLARAPERTLSFPLLSEREGRRRTRAAVSALARAEADRLGVSYGRVVVRDQRTRWGSCSSRGTLSFNWRLALAPPDVLDYVVVHELCHLREPNHSPRFWRLVEDARPEYARHERWLKDHGWELLAYVPSRGQ